MTLGDILKSYRKKNQTTVKEFAVSSGLSAALIYKLEADDLGNGKGKPNPNPGTVRQLAQAMGMSVEELENMTGIRYTELSEEEKRNKLMERQRNFYKKDVHLTLRIPKSTHMALQDAADDAGMSMNRMIVEMIEDGLTSGKVGKKN